MKTEIVSEKNRTKTNEKVEGQKTPSTTGQVRDKYCIPFYKILILCDFIKPLQSRFRHFQCLRPKSSPDRPGKIHSESLIQ